MEAEEVKSILELNEQTIQHCEAEINILTTEFKKLSIELTRTVGVNKKLASENQEYEKTAKETQMRISHLKTQMYQAPWLDFDPSEVVGSIDVRGALSKEQQIEL